MAYILDEDDIPTCRKKRPRCSFDCDHCGVDYSKCDEDDEDEQDNIHDDGFGTHW